MATAPTPTPAAADDPSPIAFDDYRDYLRAAVDARRARDKRFSLRAMAKRVEASESYLRHVLQDKRSLSVDRATALARYFKLSGTEESFFVTQVLRAKATSAAMRAYYDKLLADWRGQAQSYPAPSSDAGLFASSLVWEIFTLLGVDGFRPDFAWVKERLLRRGLTEARFRRTWAQLETHAAVTQIDGRYRGQDKVLADGKHVRHAYETALKRAVRYLEEYGVDGQGHGGGANHFDAFCLVVSDADLAAIKDELTALRLRIAAIVTKSRKEAPAAKQRIAYLATQLFPASKAAEAR